MRIEWEMFQRKKGGKVSMDELLNNSMDYKGTHVEMYDLVVDQVITPPNQYPVYIVAHDEGSSKKGIIKAYDTEVVMALLSEPGDKIDVTGTFYCNYGRKRIEVGEYGKIVNKNKSDIDY
ncbi:MAG: hypothetical protein KAU95_01530 [Candidatus Aenigmarchaeota archaeon]|nr:hypothetical protein [Candidatus Aenigmarchaeota archaeon]